MTVFQDTVAAIGAEQDTIAALHPYEIALTEAIGARTGWATQPGRALHQRTGLTIRADGTDPLRPYVVVPHDPDERVWAFASPIDAMDYCEQDGSSLFTLNQARSELARQECQRAAKHLDLAIIARPHDGRPNQVACRHCDQAWEIVDPATLRELTESAAAAADQQAWAGAQVPVRLLADLVAGWRREHGPDTTGSEVIQLLEALVVEYGGAPAMLGAPRVFPAPAVDPALRRPETGLATVDGPPEPAPEPEPPATSGDDEASRTQEILPGEPAAAGDRRALTLLPRPAPIPAGIVVDQDSADSAVARMMHATHTASLRGSAALP